MTRCSTVLDGRPVQHREVQGYESDQLTSYFKSFSVLNGGVKSGFNHWQEAEYVPRLLIVKSAARKGGHRSAVVVREVTKDQINTGDVFLLDLGKTLYQWNGKKSSGIEKVKAAEYVQGIESDRKSLEVHVIGKARWLSFPPRALVPLGKQPNNITKCLDEGDRDQSLFWKALGGQVEIKPAEEVAEEPDYVKKLYRYVQHCLLQFLASLTLFASLNVSIVLNPSTLGLPQL